MQIAAACRLSSVSQHRQRGLIWHNFLAGLNSLNATQSLGIEVEIGLSGGGGGEGPMANSRTGGSCNPFGIPRIPLQCNLHDLGH